MPNWNRLFHRRTSPPPASAPPDLLPPPDPASEAVIAAVQAFVGASSWLDIRAVLEQEQRLLLTDAALDVLQILVQQARDAGDALAPAGALMGLERARAAPDTFI